MSPLQLIDQIKDELRIDNNGKCTVSVRGAARIVGVSVQALSKSLKTGVNLEHSELAKKLTKSGIEGVNLNQFLTSGIPDTALTIIIEYYTFDAGRYCTQQAKMIYRAFAAIGLRTWLQKEVGWVSPNDDRLDKLQQSIDDVHRLLLNQGIPTHQMAVVQMILTR